MNICFWFDCNNEAKGHVCVACVKRTDDFLAKVRAEPGYSDMDELDPEHDQGMKYLTDPFTGDYYVHQ